MNALSAKSMTTIAAIATLMTLPTPAAGETLQHLSWHGQEIGAPVNTNLNFIRHKTQSASPEYTCLERPGNDDKTIRGFTAENVSYAVDAQSNVVGVRCVFVEPEESQNDHNSNQGIKLCGFAHNTFYTQNVYPEPHTEKDEAGWTWYHNTLDTVWIENKYYCVMSKMPFDKDLRKTCGKPLNIKTLKTRYMFVLTMGTTKDIQAWNATMPKRYQREILNDKRFRW